MNKKASLILEILVILGLLAWLCFRVCELRKSMKEKNSGYIAPVEVEIKDGVMTPEVLLALGRLSDPQLSPDGGKILYGVSYQSIADNRTNRNLYVCDADGSNNVQLTKYAKSANCARWSADGKSVYFVQDGQIHKAAFKGKKLGKAVKISDIPSGISEFALSPKGDKIMYISTIKSGVETPGDSDPLLSKSKAYATEDLMYRHWDHWVTEIPRTYVAKLGEGTITPENSTDILGTEELFELPTEPFGGIEQLSWNPDNRHIAYSCRKLTGRKYAFSTNTEIYIYDTESGNTVVVPMGGGYDTDPVWSPDGEKLAWISMARDGYEADQQRLMVCDVDFSDPAAPAISGIRNLSENFDHDCAGPIWHENTIYFNALVQEGVQSIFKVDATEGEVVRLTPGDWWFDFNSPFAILETGEGQKLLASYNSLMFPTELVAVDLPDGKYTQLTHTNDAIFAGLQTPLCESKQITTVDGKSMQTWVLYPPQFDSTKVYPAITIVLGGPQGTNSQGWSYRWNYRLMAQQGYIVIMPNRRGTTAFGQEWKEQISGDYIGLNMQDYLSAARSFKDKPFVGKMACCGASYGGYSAYNLMGIHEGTFDCFVAHAGIFDEEGLWFTTEEMWFPNFDNGGLQEVKFADSLEIGKQMGPAGDGITFGGISQAGSPYSNAPKAVRHYSNSPKVNIAKWNTPILCIHGMMDFRIPYTQGMAAFNAAQMMGVPSKLVIFEDATHWVTKPQDALYWHRTYFDWLDRWCK